MNIRVGISATFEGSDIFA